MYVYVLCTASSFITHILDVIVQPPSGVMLTCFFETCCSLANVNCRLSWEKQISRAYQCAWYTNMYYIDGVRYASVSELRKIIVRSNYYSLY